MSDLTNMDASAPASSGSSWTGSGSPVIRWISSFVPVGFKGEIKELSKLSIPVIMAQLMVFTVSFISTVFCGHLGKSELAGVALAIAVINVTGISIGSGLASACDTLVSQTFGSRNLLRVGVILQRAILILLLACFPCWALLLNTEPILLAVKQDPHVARIAQLYVKIFMPALPATFMYSLETRYLQSQGIIWPQVITGLFVNILNALVNYIVLYVLHLGVAGSAIANSISQFAMAGSLFAYIMWKGLHKATWGGWSKECLHDWWSYIRLAIPGMIMLCAEWWTYEIGSFLAGLISEVELGAQSVVFEVSTVVYMFPLGFGIAGSVRVGNALGAGDTMTAKTSAKLSTFCAGLISIGFAILIGCLKEHISYIFSYDEEIRKKVAEVMTFYAPFFFLDALSAALGGVVRGTGKQKVGAVCNLLGFYGVGFPIGVSLMFAAKLGIIGLWTGMLTCVFIQSSFLIIYLSRMDWKKITVEAQNRAGVSGNPSDKSPRPEDPEHSLVQPDSTLELEQGPVSEDTEPSWRNLVLLRGLALAAMLFILAVGIIINTIINSLGT
ncbi:multidrug and toxin extrusion protein 1-like isoform X2 [Gouania willdenowi]|uniref:multidrug and toxin extrusion protein 1-like isoform X2 n=1 Tax=Gouania willdenowi TaxID=441366 RepID=UPI001055DF83|nr:multidrug and toxin extrusion protein 1-like isoform X2 [Gouania willdenowi]XP_028320109.1 multidrug and toxin extrusion protein 1-like isoform X2 [Gouania willdenowi]